ncbi:MAG: hypothetical protein JNL08_00030 [Planctomycetes bacterium]|nr:hypothetical protein [Planctomycetota bacterium]
MRLPTLAILFAFAACSTEPSPQPATAPTTADAAAAKAEAAQPVPSDADCNLNTPLVPGIPGSPGHLIVSSRNPNGDSELSVLMRVFVDDLNEVRAAVLAHQPPKKLFPTHRKMRCAWPTKPSERNADFDARAQAYLANVAAFDHDPGQATYNAIINGCIACHSQSCGGPLDFIDGMKWQ